MDGIVERVVKRRRRLNEAAWAELLERFGTARLSVEVCCLSKCSSRYRELIFATICFRGRGGARNRTRANQ